MTKTVKTVTDYLEYLTHKGFIFGEDATGFIQFGQYYTETTDEIAIIAIELTLKIQKEFDGAFYISLLESFKKEAIQNRKQAFNFVENLNLI
ncbi:DUF6123 family protein [uncultured Metabacillus sp.]|uniref:DUF6123 family protein n=1 Tax=uncultured Metabacillus sp. TaxID=2860135 RepID=UPI00263608C2|nr:DUF6123 family protein [uncultured Metabacillus sp.]